MAGTPTLESFSPEMQRLISLVQCNIYLIVKHDMSREEAVVLRQMLTAPVGILTTKHNLPKISQQAQRDAQRDLRTG